MAECDDKLQPDNRSKTPGMPTMAPDEVVEWSIGLLREITKRHPDVLRDCDVESFVNDQLQPTLDDMRAPRSAVAPMLLRLADRAARGSLNADEHVDAAARLGSALLKATSTQSASGAPFPTPGEIAALRKVPYKPGVAFPDHSYEEGWNDAINAVGKLVVRASPDRSSAK